MPVKLKMIHRVPNRQYA